MQEWITVKDAARIRKCSERNIIELIKKGALEAKKDGRRWLVLIDTSQTPSEATSEIPPQISEIISVLKTGSLVNNGGTKLAHRIFHPFVIPTKVGIHNENACKMDSRFHGNDTSRQNSELYARIIPPLNPKEPKNSTSREG